MFIGGDGCAVVANLEMATGTYPTGSGHPYPYLLELSFTRQHPYPYIGRKMLSYPYPAGNLYPTGNPYPKSIPENYI